MRGGCFLVCASAFLLSSCAFPEAFPEPNPAPVAPGVPAPAAEKPPLEPDPGFKLAPLATPREIQEHVPGGALVLKGGGVAPVNAEAAPALKPVFADVLRLQQEAVAQNPADDDEKLRLAMLHASAGDLEEAERVLSTVRSRSNRLVPYLDFFLRRRLGDHKEASKILAEFNDEERLVKGFVIEKAVRIQEVRRFRDYTAAETDQVLPGGLVRLYVEPRNFTLQRVGDRHILHLKYEWKLYDDRSVERGVPAWDQARPQDREDRISSVGPIGEFYQSFNLPLPVNLAMGDYRIKVIVTDAHTGKSDQAYVPIVVTAVMKPPPPRRP